MFLFYAPSLNHRASLRAGLAEASNFGRERKLELD